MSSIVSEENTTDGEEKSLCCCDGVAVENGFPFGHIHFYWKLSWKWKVGRRCLVRDAKSVKISRNAFFSPKN